MKKKNLIKTLFLIGMLLGGTISPVVASWITGGLFRKGPVTS